MVLIPCILLAVFAPGLLFPQMAARMSATGRVGLKPKGEKSDAETQRSSAPEGLVSQQHATSGDESALSEARGAEKLT